MSPRKAHPWINSAGQTVPAQYVPQRDKKATAVVVRMAKAAFKLSQKLGELRNETIITVNAFVDWSAAQSNVKTLGGEKGNVNLTSFDGLSQVRIRRPEYIEFDERLQQAKALIDQFLKARASDSVDQALIQLVTAAFTTNRDGRVRADAVLAVQRRVKLSDPTWRNAMELIEDSKTAIQSKTYIRFYERATTEDEWALIPLDIASV